MGMKIGTEVALLRFGHGAFDQKLHLLAQPAADDEIALSSPSERRSVSTSSRTAVYLVLQFLGRGWAIQVRRNCCDRRPMSAAVTTIFRSATPAPRRRS
jgi:hypothetical protein